jgi:predicted O-methyltransferase YrrM
MSEISTPVAEEHFRYIAARTEAEDEFLRTLKHEASAAGIPQIWIAPEQASFMQILLKLARARDVVEVGTLAGYSAIAMARALPESGRVRTIEIQPAYADFAERWIARSDVAGRVTVHRGPAAELLAGFQPDSADAVFLDADKPSYPTYLRESLRIVRSGGLVMVDNALAFGELFSDSPPSAEVRAVREFNDLMARTRALHAIIVPLGDGLWVGVKR